MTSPFYDVDKALKINKKPTLFWIYLWDSLRTCYLGRKLRIIEIPLYNAHRWRQKKLCRCGQPPPSFFVYLPWLFSTSRLMIGRTFHCNLRTLHWGRADVASFCRIAGTAQSVQIEKCPLVEPFTTSNRQKNREKKGGGNHTPTALLFDPQCHVYPICTGFKEKRTGAVRGYWDICWCNNTWLRVCTSVWVCVYKGEKIGECTWVYLMRLVCMWFYTIPQG